MNGKDDSGSSKKASPRQKKRPEYLGDFVTDNEIIDEACKPTSGKEPSGPGRKIFKDDIYDCIEMLFNGSTIDTVTRHIKGIIGKDDFRKSLSRMNNADRECLKAKQLAKDNNTTSNELQNYIGKEERKDPNTGDKKLISGFKSETEYKNTLEDPVEAVARYKNTAYENTGSENMVNALKEFPMIKPYSGTERTSFFNEHYKDNNDGDINQSGVISARMLKDKYPEYYPKNIVIKEGDPYGIKSFQLNINPTHYGVCGTCWLCGETVYYYQGEYETTSCGDCEHVAGMVVSMLSGLLAYQQKELMVYGYQPSHVHCNMYKSDYITIKFEGGLWVPDEDSIDIIVNKILIDDAVHAGEYCPMLKARFQKAITSSKPETKNPLAGTIYGKHEDNIYDEEIVNDYEADCKYVINDHSVALCYAINEHYGLNNTEKSESQKMSEWVDTIASFFKQNPSSGTTSGGMDGDGDEGENPGDKKRPAEEMSKSAPGTPEYTSTSNGPSYATPVQSRIQGPMITPGGIPRGFPTNVGQTGTGESGALFHAAEYLSAKQAAEDIAAAAEQAAYHQQRQLAGHTLNLFNAAVMLLYMNKDSSFMECMRDAGIRLRQPAETKEEHARGEGEEDEDLTEREEFTQESVIEVSPPPEEYNTQQYYDNYKQLVDEFRGNGGDGDGCNHVIYIYYPNQALRDYMNTENYKNDIQIETGSSNSGPNDCFETIVERVLCSRHQQKIDEGDTQLHVYVPTINNLQENNMKEGELPGGMLKKPKQRKTRKHNQKKKKRTIRKNKQQQHTKRSKRTSKKKSHKKSNKK